MSRYKIKPDMGFWKWLGCSLGNMNACVIVYFVVAVLVFGGAGVSIAIIHEWSSDGKLPLGRVICTKNVLWAVCTYMPAVVGPAIFDVLYNDQWPKLAKGITVSLCVCVLVCSLLVLWVMSPTLTYIALGVACVVWLIVNSGDNKFESTRFIPGSEDPMRKDF